MFPNWCHCIVQVNEAQATRIADQALAAIRRSQDEVSNYPSHVRQSLKDPIRLLVELSVWVPGADMDG